MGSLFYLPFCMFIRGILDGLYFYHNREKIKIKHIFWTPMATFGGGLFSSVFDLGHSKPVKIEIYLLHEQRRHLL